MIIIGQIGSDDVGNNDEEGGGGGGTFVFELNDASDLSRVVIP